MNRWIVVTDESPPSAYLMGYKVKPSADVLKEKHWVLEEETWVLDFPKDDWWNVYPEDRVSLLEQMEKDWTTLAQFNWRLYFGIDRTFGHFLSKEGVNYLEIAEKYKLPEVQNALNALRDTPKTAELDFGAHAAIHVLLNVDTSCTQLGLKRRNSLKTVIAFVQEHKDLFNKNPALWDDSDVKPGLKHLHKRWFSEDPTRFGRLVYKILNIICIEYQAEYQAEYLSAKLIYRALTEVPFVDSTASFGIYGCWYSSVGLQTIISACVNLPARHMHTMSLEVGEMTTSLLEPDKQQAVEYIDGRELQFGNVIYDVELVKLSDGNASIENYKDLIPKIPPLSKNVDNEIQQESGRVIMFKKGATGFLYLIHLSPSLTTSALGSEDGGLFWSHEQLWTETEPFVWKAVMEEHPGRREGRPSGALHEVMYRPYPTVYIAVAVGVLFGFVYLND